MKARIAIFGLLAASLVTLLLAVPAAAGPRFLDLPAGYPSSDAIYSLSSRGVISGYDNGDFGAGDPVTRAQFAKMIVLTLGWSATEQDSCSFSDLSPEPSSLYPYHFVAVAAKNGVIAGYPDGTFRPTTQITRMQVITMVVRAAASRLSEPPAAWRGVLDYSNPWHGTNVRLAEADGLLANIPDLVTWDTGKSATRGEVAQLLANLLVKEGARPGLSVFTYGAQGDGVTDDAAAFQEVINRAAAIGGTVLVSPTPAGYRLDSTVQLESNVTIEGDGTTLTMSAQGSGTFIFSGTAVQDVTIEGLTLRAAADDAKVSGIFMAGVKDCRLTDLRLENLDYGLKLGTGSTSTGLAVTGIVARSCAQPLFAADVTDSSFTGMDLQADATTANHWHTVYLERDLHRLSFKDLTLSGGGGYCLQLYTVNGPSSDLAFEDVVLDATEGRFPLVIWDNYSDVSFKNLTMAMKPTAPGVCVQLRAPHDVSFDGFAASGGYALVGTYDDQPTPAGRITFSNGTYRGPALVSPARNENRIVALDIRSSVTLESAVVPTTP